MTLSPSSFQDESTDSESEEAASEDQHQAVLVEDTAEGKPSGLGYMAARRRALKRAEDSMPNIFEVGQMRHTFSLFTSSDLTITCWDTNITRLVPRVTTGLPIMPSPIATPAPAATLDEDDLLEVGAQLEQATVTFGEYTSR
ncbi:hypothetical protein Tco_1153206 [Tanacetum coccineum]